jgi:hypothetical protein
MAPETGETYLESGSLFDIEFHGLGNGADNHVLCLDLVLCCQQILVPPNQIKDASGNLFNIQNWAPAEWLAFRQTVLNQSATWDRRFVLTPPSSCAGLMYKTGTALGLGKVLGTEFDYLPNAECRFRLFVHDSPAGAHRTIRVARLSDSYNLSAMDSSSFRSHATLYDSLDGQVHVFQIPDDLGSIHLIRHYTIPHEIGHALGQGHIGQLKSTTACQAAMDTTRVGPPASTEVGGSNSLVCYGWGSRRRSRKTSWGSGCATTR